MYQHEKEYNSKESFWNLFRGSNSLRKAFLNLGKTIKDALDITKTAKKAEKTVSSTVSGISRALAGFDEVDILKMPSSGSSKTSASSSADTQSVTLFERVLAALSRLPGLGVVLQMLMKLPSLLSSLLGPLEKATGIFGIFGNLFNKTAADMEKTRSSTQALAYAAQNLHTAWSCVTGAMQQWQQAALKVREVNFQQPLAETGLQVRQLAGAFLEVGQASSGVLTSICNRWGSLGSWFRSNVSNRLISETNSLLAGITQGINQVLCSAGARSMGLNYSKLAAPKIPHLAKGAVLPANKPFLAVVGDQKNGTNVEAPLETIKKAVSEVVGSNDVVINFTGDLAQLARVLRPVMEKENARVGGRLITREVM